MFKFVRSGVAARLTLQGLYLGFPLALMVWVGEPDFYIRRVAHLVPAWRAEDRQTVRHVPCTPLTCQRQPHNADELRDMIAELKARRQREREGISAGRDDPASTPVSRSRLV